MVTESAQSEGTQQLQTRKTESQQASQQPKSWSTNWAWLFAGCLLLLIANLVRSWPVFTHPGFYVEDAALFSRYYGNGLPVTDIWAYLFGQPYKMVVTNFLAWCIGHLDVRVHLQVYLWTGFAWGTTAACCFFFTGLIRSRSVLLLGPLLIGLSGMNHIFYYNTLIFVMYSCLAVLLILFFFPAPKSIFNALPLFVLCLFLPWAGPYSAVAVPISLFMLLLFWQDLNRTKRFLLLTSGLSAFLYYLTVQGGTSTIMRLKRVSVIQTYLDSILDRIFYFDLFGYVPPWFWIPILLIIGGSFLLFRKDTVFIKNSLLMLATIFGSFTLFYLSSKYPVYIRPKPCHMFLSAFFWCVYLLYLVDHLFQRYGEQKIPVTIFLVLLCTVIFFDNKKHKDKNTVSPLTGTDTYIAAIHAMEQQHLKKKNQYVILRHQTSQHHVMHPWVQIGSRQADAQQLFPDDLPAKLQSEFVSSSEERRPETLE